jgi:hypothetical protein
MIKFMATIENITNTVPVFAGLLDSIIEELGAKDRREHERRMVTT